MLNDIQFLGALWGFRGVQDPPRAPQKARKIHQIAYELVIMIGNDPYTVEYHTWTIVQH